MTITVRAIERRDEAAWRLAFRDYNAFYGIELGEDVVATTFERLLSGAPECHIGLVAVDEADKLTGFALVLFHRSTWTVGWYCYLEDLYVIPEARGEGVGRALIEATYAQADARGASRTYWVTQEDNEQARALYDRVATKTPFVRYVR